MRHRAESPPAPRPVLTYEEALERTRRRFSEGQEVECIDPGYDDAWALPAGRYVVARVEANNLGLEGRPMLYASRRFRPVTEEIAEVAVMSTGSPNRDEEWDGVPAKPDVPGWHLLRRIRPEWAAGEEEVFRHDRSKELAWARVENGSRHGHEEKHICWNWSYLGRLEITET